jgi:hypothetical protein
MGIFSYLTEIGGSLHGGFVRAPSSAPWSLLAGILSYLTKIGGSLRDSSIHAILSLD